MAGSLILTGALQLLFSRFVADQIYTRHPEAVLPNLLGALTLTTLVAGTLASLAMLLLFDDPFPYRLLMVSTFVVLCDLWILIVLLSALKNYQAVLATVFCGYLLTVAAAYALRSLGPSGLLAGFFLGHVAMFATMLLLVARHYPSAELLSFDFLTRRHAYYSLALTGFFYNLGIWADKILFWQHPLTSDPVHGPLRASLIYDLPIFLAYLSIVPGMAVFLVRVETDFAEHYDGFYNAIRDGHLLSHIEHLKDRMVYAVRQGIYEIFKVQGLTVLGLLLAGPQLLQLIGISPLYLQLYNVDLVAVAVQVLLLAILNVFFYLDQRATVLALSLFLTISNTALTVLSQYLGPAFYGYGFALAVSLTALLGLLLLSRKLDRLEYETFMLQT